MSEREQSPGLALAGGIFLLVALAAVWSQANPDFDAPSAPDPPNPTQAPGPTPEASGVPSPRAPTAAKPQAVPSPEPEEAPSMLGNTRGRAALELIGPSGPAVEAWVAGKALDPEGQPLVGAEVWLETSAGDVWARGVTEGEGRFSLEASYEPAQATRYDKLVVRRAFKGGIAQGEVWVRLPGGTEGLEIATHFGFDLELRFPFAVRSEVILGGPRREARKLPAREGAPQRKLAGLAGGELWVAVTGIDASGGWWVGLAKGHLKTGSPLLWEVPLDPFAKLAITVQGPQGASTPAKLVMTPLEGNRFADSSLRRHGQGLAFEEQDEEGPELPGFGVLSKAGLGKIALPPGPWRVSAYGPPGTRPAHVEVKVGSGRAGDQELSLRLGLALACEFELPAGAREGEVVVRAPAGAYLEDLGEGRWRVAGLGERDRVDVFLMRSEAPPEDEEEGDTPLDEPAPTSCARLRLAPGARERLALVRTASLEVLLPKEEGAWEVMVEDLGTSDQAYSLAWDLEEDPLTPSGPYETDDTPREQAWLGELREAITSFDRCPGWPVGSSDIEDDAIRLSDLFPGAAKVSVRSPSGLSSTHTLKLVPGETATLDLSR